MTGAGRGDESAGTPAEPSFEPESAEDLRRLLRETQASFDALKAEHAALEVQRRIETDASHSDERGEPPEVTVEFLSAEPADEQTRQLQARAEEQARDALPIIRSAAEKWGATTAAIFTALGFASFLQGRKQIQGLAGIWEVIVGVAVLLAFLLALVAIVYAALAAQGTPKPVAVSGPELRVLEANEARRARGRLLRSRRGAALAIVLVIAGLATLWYAPTDDEVLLRLGSGELMCGTLRSEDQGHVALDTPDGVVRVRGVESVTRVSECPDGGR